MIYKKVWQKREEGVWRGWNAEGRKENCQLLIKPNEDNLISEDVSAAVYWLKSSYGPDQSAAPRIVAVKPGYQIETTVAGQLGHFDVFGRLTLETEKVNVDFLLVKLVQDSLELISVGRRSQRC